MNSKNQTRRPTVCKCFTFCVRESAKKGRQLPWFVVILGALAVACSSGGEGGENGESTVVVTGAVAADEIAQSHGIGSYDIGNATNGYLVTIYDLTGQLVGNARIDAPATDGVVFEFQPEGNETYSPGKVWLVDEGFIESPEMTRIVVEVPDDRAPMRLIRIEFGLTNTGDVMLRAPVDLNRDYPPSLGGTFGDSGMRAQANLSAIEGGTAVHDEADLLSWLEAMGFGSVRHSPTTSLLLGLVFDSELNDAIFTQAGERLEASTSSVDGALRVATGALHETSACDRENLRIQCSSECQTEGDLPDDWFGFVRPDCLACMTLYLPRFRDIGDCIGANASTVDDGWCKTNYIHCGLGLNPVADSDGHSCRCICLPSACELHCEQVGNLLNLTTTGSHSCADDGRECSCSFDATSYCDAQWGEAYCGTGAYLDPVDWFACDTAACGDGWVNEVCERNPSRAEECDASSRTGHGACGTDSECIDCACVPCEQSVVCGDGRISTNCPDFIEECDHFAVPAGCESGNRCEDCGCVPILQPTVVPDAGGTPDNGGTTQPDAGGSVPAACSAMLACAATAAPDQYDTLNYTYGADGTCHRATNAPAGTCESSCQDLLSAWQSSGDC